MWQEAVVPLRRVSGSTEEEYERINTQYLSYTNLTASFSLRWQYVYEVSNCQVLKEGFLYREVV